MHLLGDLHGVKHSKSKVSEFLMMRHIRQMLTKMPMGAYRLCIALEANDDSSFAFVKGKRRVHVWASTGHLVLLMNTCQAILESRHSGLLLK